MKQNKLFRSIKINPHQSSIKQLSYLKYWENQNKSSNHTKNHYSIADSACKTNPVTREKLWSNPATAV